MTNLGRQNEQFAQDAVGDLYAWQINDSTCKNIKELIYGNRSRHMVRLAKDRKF